MIPRIRTLLNKILSIFYCKKQKYNNILSDCTEIYFNSKNELCINSSNGLNVVTTYCQNVPINDLIINKKNFYYNDYSIDNESISLCEAYQKI